MIVLLGNNLILEVRSASFVLVGNGVLPMLRNVSIVMQVAIALALELLNVQSV